MTDRENMFGLSGLGDLVTEPFVSIRDEYLSLALSTYADSLAESVDAAHSQGFDLAVSSPFWEDGQVRWLTKFLPAGSIAVPVLPEEHKAGRWTIFRCAGEAVDD